MKFQKFRSTFSVASQSLLLIIAIVSVVVAYDSNTDGQQQLDKRQPIPMPRIGRSSSYYNDAKRQSLIPAPRIGRRSQNTGATTNNNNNNNQETGNDGHKMMTRSIDCQINPDMCANYETVEQMSNGAGAGPPGNEDLIEPLDIQLRAAFIPRLGKRSAYSKSSPSSLSLHPAKSSQSSSGANSDEESMIDIYRPGTIGGRVFGFIPRLSSNLLPNNINFDDDNAAADDDVQRFMFLHDWMQQNIGPNKRAAASPYTPRIGRAVLVPRIGKKSAFVPRIG